MLGVSLDEDITTVQATEESDDCIKACVGFLIIETLQTLLKFIITIGSHIIWSQRALIHEILERYVSVLLEADVIEETFLNHVIDLSLECKQFLSELNWVLLQVLV